MRLTLAVASVVESAFGLRIRAPFGDTTQGLPKLHTCDASLMTMREPSAGDAGSVRVSPADLTSANVSSVFAGNVCEVVTRSMVRSDVIELEPDGPGVPTC